ncbi:hypothetical protein OAK17_07715 [Alphaproteobacteria bacterium]|nr:hypothetical protein [Alphaproteobacteria bacterium]
MKKQFKILSTVDLTDCIDGISELEQIGDLTCMEPSREKVLNKIHIFDAYIASASILVDGEFIDKAKNLKIIGSPSTGTDHLSIEAIQKRNITLFDISKEFDLINSFTATSELAFGLTISLIRKLMPAINSAKKGDWAREKYTGFQLSNKTLGIIGLGRLGTISAKIGQGFGMKIIAHDIVNKNVNNVTMMTFEQVLRLSDIITVHIHLNNSTKGLINKNCFSLMKQNSILINTSRGAIIDENSLLEALKNGYIAGAGLDMIEGEWLKQSDIYNHPLIEYSRQNNNLIITPHIGGSSKESISGARNFMTKKVASWLANNSL